MYVSICVWIEQKILVHLLVHVFLKLAFPVSPYIPSANAILSCLQLYTLCLICIKKM